MPLARSNLICKSLWRVFEIHSTAKIQYQWHCCKKGKNWLQTISKYLQTVALVYLDQTGMEIICLGKTDRIEILEILYNFVQMFRCTLVLTYQEGTKLYKTAFAILQNINCSMSFYRKHVSHSKISASRFLGIKRTTFQESKHTWQVCPICISQSPCYHLVPRG